jgi:hypothetical protein
MERLLPIRSGLEGSRDIDFARRLVPWINYLKKLLRAATHEMAVRTFRAKGFEISTRSLWFLKNLEGASQAGQSVGMALGKQGLRESGCPPGEFSGHPASRANGDSLGFFSQPHPVPCFASNCPKNVNLSHYRYPT